MGVWELGVTEWKWEFKSGSLFGLGVEVKSTTPNTQVRRGSKKTILFFFGVELSNTTLIAPTPELPLKLTPSHLIDGLTPS